MATLYRVLYPFSAEARGELTVAANVRVELIAGEEHAGEEGVQRDTGCARGGHAACIGCRFLGRRRPPPNGASR